MSLYVDKNAIMNVIGCLFTNSELLEDEQYIFIKEDFYDTLPKIIYSSLYNLYIDGIKKFDFVILNEYLSKTQEVYNIFQKNGIDYLKHCIKLSSLENFNYYYERMKKFTLLRAMDQCGINMKWFYDPTIPVLSVKDMEAQENRLNNTSLNEINLLIDKHIEEVKLQCSLSDDKVGISASIGISELLDNLQRNPEIGIPMYGDYINTVTKGARLSKLYLRSAATGVGKAIPNSTIIPTPNGFKRADEIIVGDYLFDRLGNETLVLGVYPQGLRKVWEITFDDGRKAKCCEDHLWSFYTNDSIKLQTLTLKEIIKRQDKYKLLFPINKPVQYSTKQIQSNYDAHTVGTAIGYNQTLFCMTIPEGYTTTDIQTRWKLFYGLLDEAYKTNKGYYWTIINEQYKNQLLELGRSLGIIMDCVHEYKHVEGYAEKLTLHYRVRAYTNSYFNTIINIKCLNYYDEMVCFLVDNHEHLFLMNDYIVTHNTRTMIADACTFSCNQLYNSEFGLWEDKDIHEPTLYITTEQEIDEIQTMLLAFIADIDEEQILESKLSFEEIDRLKTAIHVLETSPLYVVSCPDFSLSDIENIIKINIKKYNIKYVCYDYLHASMKILEEITRRSGGIRLREDNILFMLSVALKDLCNKYQVFILTSTQLNGSWIEAKDVNQNLLRGAKSIADKVDLGCIIMPLRDFELEKIQYVIQQLQCDTPTIGIHFYKNRRSKYKDIIIWCKNDLGKCKIYPLFVTDSNLKLIEIPNYKIQLKG